MSDQSGRPLRCIGQKWKGKHFLSLSMFITFSSYHLLTNGLWISSYSFISRWTTLAFHLSCGLFQFLRDKSSPVVIIFITQFSNTSWGEVSVFAASLPGCGQVFSGDFIFISSVQSLVNHIFQIQHYSQCLYCTGSLYFCFRLFGLRISLSHWFWSRQQLYIPRCSFSDFGSIFFWSFQGSIHKKLKSLLMTDLDSETGPVLTDQSTVLHRKMSLVLHRRRLNWMVGLGKHFSQRIPWSNLPNCRVHLYKDRLHFAHQLRVNPMNYQWPPRYLLHLKQRLRW